MKKITIGIIQPKIFFDKRKSFEENDKKNLKHALKLFKKFKRDEVDLVVCPELYPCKTLQVANTKELRDEAKRVNSYFLIGESYRKDYKKYNSATIISPSGKIVGRHFKIQLWKNESKYYYSGKKLRLFNIKNVKVGILICSDFYGWKIPAKLISKGPELLIVMSNAVASFLDFWKHELIYVSDYGRVPIVFVNCVFYKGLSGAHGGGRSKVILPLSKKKVTEKELTWSKKLLLKHEDLIGLELGKGEQVTKFTIDIEKYNKYRKSKLPVTIK